MAGVDALLSIAVGQAAEGLVLTAGEVPVLLKGDEQRKLSMPPLEPSIVKRFIEELQETGAVERYALEARGARAEFDVAIESDRSLAFRRADGGPSGSEPDLATAGIPPGDAPARRPAPRDDAIGAALRSLVARAIERLRA